MRRVSERRDGRARFDVFEGIRGKRQYAQARTWYARAIAIDPQMQRAREALARLPRT